MLALMVIAFVVLGLNYRDRNLQPVHQPMHQQ
jgi:hypothetical protein